MLVARKYWTVVCEIGFRVCLGVAVLGLLALTSCLFPLGGSVQYYTDQSLQLTDLGLLNREMAFKETLDALMATVFTCLEFYLPLFLRI